MPAASTPRPCTELSASIALQEKTRGAAHPLTKRAKEQLASMHDTHATRAAARRPSRDEMKMFQEMYAELGLAPDDLAALHEHWSSLSSPERLDHYLNYEAELATRKAATSSALRSPAAKAAASAEPAKGKTKDPVVAVRKPALPSPPSPADAKAPSTKEPARPKVAQTEVAARGPAAPSENWAVDAKPPSKGQPANGNVEDDEDLFQELFGRHNLPPDVLKQRREQWDRLTPRQRREAAAIYRRSIRPEVTSK